MDVQDNQGISFPEYYQKYNQQKQLEYGECYTTIYNWKS